MPIFWPTKYLFGGGFWRFHFDSWGRWTHFEGAILFKWLEFRLETTYSSKMCLELAPSQKLVQPPSRSSNPLRFWWRCFPPSLAIPVGEEDVDSPETLRLDSPISKHGFRRQAPFWGVLLENLSDFVLGGVEIRDTRSHQTKIFPQNNSPKYFPKYFQLRLRKKKIIPSQPTPPAGINSAPPKLENFWGILSWSRMGFGKRPTCSWVFSPAKKKVVKSWVDRSGNPRPKKMAKVG